MFRRVRLEATDLDVTGKQGMALFGDGMADDLPATRAILQPYPVNIN